MDKEFSIKEIKLENVFHARLKKFQKLMRFKIQEILLVSSIYDYYLFEEDGRLYELIRSEYQNLNLSQAPEITHVTTGEEAIELLKAEHLLRLRNYYLVNFNFLSIGIDRQSLTFAARAGLNFPDDDRALKTFLENIKFIPTLPYLT